MRRPWWMTQEDWDYAEMDRECDEQVERERREDEEEKYLESFRERQEARNENK